MTTYRIVSTDFFHAPGALRWCLSMENKALSKSARNDAARLYMLASSLPTLSGGVLLDIVQGKLKPIYEGSTVVIDVPDTDASTTVTVLDRDGLEPCGLFDDELEFIWNNDDLVEVLSDARENVARKDPETGDVWVMCWARVGARGEVSDGG
jgi:hypothetical protein